MAKLTTEEEINLKRITRRRVIGAVALVLVVVILLPIIFDGEPTPSAGNNIDLRIPGKDTAPEFQPKINLPELDKMASEVAPTSTVAATSAPAAVLSPAPEVKPQVAPAPVAVAPKPEPKVAPKPEPKAKPAPVKPKTEPKPAAKPAPKTGWGVQVGAFANAETAKGIQAKLSKQGYHAYTEKAGNVTRVRVGGYPTREAAEKIQRKLEAQGTHGNVVNLE